MGLKKTFSFVNLALNGWTNGKAKRLIRISIVILILAASALAFLFIHSYRSYAKIVDARMAHGYLVSRAGIYAAPRTLRTGQKYSRDGLAAVLRRAGYVESEDASEVWNGGFMVRNDSIEIRPNNNGNYPSLIRVKFASPDRIAEISGDDMGLDSFTLAPESLTNDSSKSGARAQLSFKDIPLVLVHAITSI